MTDENKTALLSKLRAPVADESPMAKMADALREKARQERQAYQDSRVQTTEWGPMSAGTEADDPSSLAALADGLESIKGNENAAMAATYIRAQAARLASAPVAGEAIGYSTGIQWRPRQSEQSIKLTRNPQPEYGFVHALYAAPQASEAMRPCTCQPDWSAALSAQPGAQKEQSDA